MQAAMFAAAAVCTFVLLDSTVLSATRIPFTMAEDGYFHRSLARLNPRFRHASACHFALDRGLCCTRGGQFDTIDCDLCLVADINFDADSIGGLAAATDGARPEAGVCGSGRQGRSGGSGACTQRSVRLGAVQQRPFRPALGSRLPEFGTLGVSGSN